MISIHQERWQEQILIIIGFLVSEPIAPHRMRWRWPCSTGRDLKSNLHLSVAHFSRRPMASCSEGTGLGYWSRPQGEEMCFFLHFYFSTSSGRAKVRGMGSNCLFLERWGGSRRGELRRVLAGVYIMIAVSALLKICSPHTLVYPLSLRPFPSS